MSLTADRAAIAAAASTVEGITCSPTYVQSLSAGDGSVRYVGANAAANGFGFVHTWEVAVALSTDVVTAEEWIDTHLEELAAALRPEIHVDTITATELLLPAGSVINGLIVTGTR
jgi:hypothetical protein